MLRSSGWNLLVGNERGWLRGAWGLEGCVVLDRMGCCVLVFGNFPRIEYKKLNVLRCDQHAVDFSHERNPGL